MMRIVIEVNGDIIETIEVVNRGPHHNGLPGLFAPSDHAGGPGGASLPLASQRTVGQRLPRPR